VDLGAAHSAAGGMPSEGGKAKRLRHAMDGWDVDTLVPSSTAVSMTAEREDAAAAAAAPAAPAGGRGSAKLERAAGVSKPSAHHIAALLGGSEFIAPAGRGGSSLVEVHAAVAEALRHRAEVEASRGSKRTTPKPTTTDFVRAVLEGRRNDALSAGLDLELQLDALDVDGVPLVVAEMREGHDLMAAVLMELGGHLVTPRGTNLVVEAARARLWGLVDYWLVACPDLLDSAAVVEALEARHSSAAATADVSGGGERTVGARAPVVAVGGKRRRAEGAVEGV
jgi:hypothetical protein